MTMNLEELLEIESTCRDDVTVDLRALEYVSSYDAHLMCPICHCAFVRPVRLQCDHIFCQRCLSFAVTSCSERDDFNCPTCRTPTNDVHTDVPRLLMNMCDDIRVKCPYSTEGCPKVVPRGHVELHVEKYCGYKPVECPSETCNQETQKKDLIEDKCRHELRQCLGCEEDIMDQDYEEHTNRLCPSLETLCADCDEIVPLRDLEQHISICPEAILPCAAAKYGCQARVKRASIASHEQQCPLVAMSPCFEAQNARIDSLELTIRHLQQRNEIFEDGISNIRSTLVDSPRSRNNNNRPGNTTAQDETTNSNATNYLLSVHESLRTEVGQLSHAITDLDARASMSIMNESLRIKEDMAHTNAAVNSIRMQVQWLINPRLHQVQRASSDAANDRTGSESAAANASSSSAASGSLGLRPRRLSDSAREGTKL